MKLTALSLLAIIGCGETPSQESIDAHVGEVTPAPTPAQDAEPNHLDGLGRGAVQEELDGDLAKANEEFWAEEKITNALSAGPLLKMKLLLLGPWSKAKHPPRLDEIFTADARIGALAPAEYTEEQVTLGVVRRVWTGETPLQSSSDWERSLASLHTATKRVRWTLLKPAGVQLTDYGARVEVKWRVNREHPTGALQHDSGIWVSEWVDQAPDDDEPEWRCRKLAPLRDCSTLLAEAPHFVESTGEALKDTSLDPRLPTALTGKHRGVALSDLDADGDLDLIVTLPCRVLYNRGDGTFVDRSAELLPEEVLQAEAGANGFAGVLAADFNRDGLQDLFLAGNYRSSMLLLQRESGFRGHRVKNSHTDNIAASLAAHDVDGDGWLDVFVCGYGPFVDPGPNDFTSATNGKRNQMLQGGPRGSFKDVTTEWGLDVHAERWTFTGAFGDPDGDGDMDLYIANDFGPNVFYRRVSGDQGAVRFEAELEAADEIEPGFSMSATWGDLDGDLDQDLYVSNMSSTAAKRVRSLEGDRGESHVGVDLNDMRRWMSKGNTVVLNQGTQLVEAGKEHGGKDAMWAWGTALFDYDCDGDLDIHCVNGFLTHGADDGRDL